MTRPDETFFSVIVPTRGRPEALGRCLEALAGLDYPRERFEVIVVDDASPETLEPVVKPWRARLPVRLLRQAHAGPAAARNRGAAVAAGTWLAFLDDDCRPAPGWLRALTASHAEVSEALGGTTKNALPDNPYSAASHALVMFVCDWLCREHSTLGFLPSNNFAVSAERFHRLKGFATDFPQAAAEDRDFCCRWVQLGGRLRLVPDAVVDHAHPLGPLSFWRQQFNYGRGARIFHDRRTCGERIHKQMLPPAYYVALMAQPWRTLRGWSALRQCLLLAISQVANAAGYFFQGGSVK